MSKSPEFPRSTPGSKHIFQDVEYVAVPAHPNGQCNGCVFDELLSPDGCNSTPAGCAPNQTIWMTPLNYITYRLTS